MRLTLSFLCAFSILSVVGYFGWTYIPRLWRRWFGRGERHYDHIEHSTMNSVFDTTVDSNSSMMLTRRTTHRNRRTNRPLSTRSRTRYHLHLDMPEKIKVNEADGENENKKVFAKRSGSSRSSWKKFADRLGASFGNDRRKKHGHPDKVVFKRNRSANRSRGYSSNYSSSSSSSSNFKTSHVKVDLCQYKNEDDHQLEGLVGLFHAKVKSLVGKYRKVVAKEYFFNLDKFWEPMKLRENKRAMEIQELKQKENQCIDQLQKLSAITKTYKEENTKLKNLVKNAIDQFKQNSEIAELKYTNEIAQLKNEHARIIKETIEKYKMTTVVDPFKHSNEALLLQQSKDKIIDAEILSSPEIAPSGQLHKEINSKRDTTEILQLRDNSDNNNALSHGSFDRNNSLFLKETRRGPESMNIDYFSNDFMSNLETELLDDDAVEITKSTPMQNQSDALEFNGFNDLSTSNNRSKDKPDGIIHRDTKKGKVTFSDEANAPKPRSILKNKSTKSTEKSTDRNLEKSKSKIRSNNKNKNKNKTKNKNKSKKPQDSLFDKDSYIDYLEGELVPKVRTKKSSSTAPEKSPISQKRGLELNINSDDNSEEESNDDDYDDYAKEEEEEDDDDDDEETKKEKEKARQDSENLGILLNKVIKDSRWW